MKNFLISQGSDPMGPFVTPQVADSVYSVGRKHDGAGNALLRAIILGFCVSVQGAFVRYLPDENTVVRVGMTEFVGRPVAKAG